MKRKVSIALSLLVAFIVVSGAFATGDPPGSGWWSGEQIQNVGDAEANITVTAYDAESANTFLASNTAGVGGAYTFLPFDFVGMPDGFKGSAIVASDQPIRGIVNVTNQFVNIGGGGSWGVIGGKAAGQYQGINEGSTLLNFPLAKYNYYDKTTTYYIQNAGGSPATANVTFFANGNEYTYETPSIDPGRMVSVQPSDAGMPSGKTLGLGSMVVTSTEKLAGTVLEHWHVEDPATILHATRGFVPENAGTIVFTPILKQNYYGKWTGLQVQNTGGADIDITVTYKGAEIQPGSPIDCTGNEYVDTQVDIAPGASATFLHLSGLTTIPTGCLAAGTVVATGPVVAIVNEEYLPSLPGTQFATYSSFEKTSATEKVSLPLFKEDYYNLYTGIMVQNVGDIAATNVVLTFVGTPAVGEFVSTPKTIQPGEALKVMQIRLKDGSWWTGAAPTPAVLGCDYKGCGANGLFGIIVTADQPIVSIANEESYWVHPVPGGMDANNYEGFNLAP